MKSFGRRVSVTAAILTMLCLPSVARAQRFVALGGGTNVTQGPALPFQNLSSGFAAQASFGYRIALRLRVRFDGLVSHFTASSVAVVPQLLYCAPAVGCGSGTAVPTGPVGVTALVVSELIDVLPAAPDGAGFYLIAAGGAYYLFQHPTAPALVRFGLSGGAGLELRLEGNSALFLEARYHGLMHAPADARWLVPVTVGMRF